MNLGQLKTPVLVLTLLVSLAPKAHEASPRNTSEALSRIQGFELVSCNQQKKCIKLNSKKADSGTLSPIMTIKDFRLEITNNGNSRNVTGTFGYYDVQEGKLVLTASSGKEIEIILKDLSEKEY